MIRVAWPMPQADGYPFSLLSLSPFNLPDSRRLHIAIKGYFDGSGKPEDELVITLGGISASEDVWPRLEDEWAHALSVIGTERWHTADAHASMTRPEFSRATVLLFGVIGRHRAALAHSYSATVILPDYRRARAEGVPLPEKPEAICVNWCVGQFVIPDAEDLPVLLYFDDNEDFMHLVRRVWQKARRGGRQSRGWPWQVVEILPIASRPYAMQMADLIAWCGGRREMLRVMRNRGNVDRRRPIIFRRLAAACAWPRRRGAGSSHPRSR